MKKYILFLGKIQVLNSIKNGSQLKKNKKKL